MNNLDVLKRRAEWCVKHHNACNCREYEHKKRIAELKTKIERLHDELGDANILTSNMGEEIKELKAEIERLREALLACQDQVDFGGFDLKTQKLVEKALGDD
jgi:septal ring factor EnvC (AmiA/AmiB activator)